MLRSSGFFRGVECPFGPACGRPYCHFRHPPGHAWPAAATTEARRRLRPQAGPSARAPAAAGCGYDPYNPELPKPATRTRNGALEDIGESAPSVLELELVNKAIEAVRNEVEREQKKYEELLETTKETSLVSKAARSAAPSTFTPLEYSPGCYDMNSNIDYNPTPLPAASAGRSSKYTLDPIENVKAKGSSLEYVPTIVTQPKKYSCPVAKCKYIVDDSKPSTDLEYDPLSNYSARLLSKASTGKQQGGRPKRARDPGEAYLPLLKKHRGTLRDPEPVARFSDSEEEGQAASCKPSAGLGSELDAEEARPAREDPSSRQMKETAVQYDTGDFNSSRGAAGKGALKKDASKGPRKEERKQNRDSPKAEGKRVQGKVADREKAGVKVERRNGERVKEKPGKSHADGQSKKGEKAKSGRAAGGKEGGSGKGKGSKKPGSPKDAKLRPGDSKARKEASRGEGKGKLPKKPKERLAAAAPEARCKGKQRALSHADLFGDESEDEGQAARQPRAAAFPSVSSDWDGGDDGWPPPQKNGVAGARRPKPSKSPPPPSSSSSEDMDYSVLERDLDFESDPMEECLRIFNESMDVKTEDKGRLGKQPPKQEGTKERVTENSLTTLFPGQKRRISHLPKQGNAEVPSKPVIRPYRPPTAQEVCYQRIQLAQQQAAQLAQQQQLAPQLPPRGSFTLQKGGKKRIAHVPSTAIPEAARSVPGGLQKPAASRNVAPSNGADALSLKARTFAGMASKTTTTNVPKRTAHALTLQSAALKRPVIPAEFGAKVPTSIRQRYLNLFIDECLKSCPLQQEAFDKALSEEKMAYDRSTSRNIYLNVAVNTLKKLRSLLPSPAQGSPKPSNKKVVSHEAMLGGKLAARTSFTLNRSPSVRTVELTGAALFQRLKEYVMTEEDLKENGYPLPCPDKPGRAVVFTAEEKKSSEGLCRVCCRCGTEYMVTASGNCVRKEECVHHWGRLRKQRAPGGWETHYNCCSGAVGSPGCQVAKQHVHDGRKENLDGFVKTFEKLPGRDGYPGAFALDCEMCYTKQGLELTRVTVINADLKVVYDTFVKPDHKVVDYNTRFSGVTEADLENASITLRDVQAVLLNMFSTDTILIGHSLESDLFALKLIHCTVVDTAVVFPHRLGMPYKRALRTLMADYLKRIIQDSVDGHDSSEDARACMELMIWKIKEDAKVKR